jgi:hypothetical protein
MKSKGVTNRKKKEEIRRNMPQMTVTSKSRKMPREKET